MDRSSDQELPGIGEGGEFGVVILIDVSVSFATILVPRAAAG
ncbi:hypothetical protein OHT93_03210 [Streptomyces sp. NBC_00191]